MVSEYIISQNPDFIYRKQIEEEIKANDGFCISSVNHTEDTKCVCTEFKKQENSGFCKCKQFYKVLNAPIVCLCGNLEFKDLFLNFAASYTLNGYIVMMPPVLNNPDIITEEEKTIINEVQKAKIAEADLVFIINYQGQIDSETKNQINWATQLGKKIEYLENEIDWQS